MKRLLSIFLCCLVFTGARAAQPEEPARSGHAVLRFRGDLDNAHAARTFRDALTRLAESASSTVLVEFSGDRARADLLFDTLGHALDLDTDLAVFLADPGDRTVGPGQLALALAARHAAIAPGVRISREPADHLEHLNPDIEDWSVINLDLRARAAVLAERRGLSRLAAEAPLAPRGEVWLVDHAGVPALADEQTAAAVPVVLRGEAGWSFDLAGADAARLYGLETHRSPRVFARMLGYRSRPLDEIDIDSNLTDSHDRCRLLVDRVRVATSLADAALDVFANRRGRESILSRDYHAAADRAAALVAECREAIAEVQAISARFPEVLHMDPPPDATAPTEIGGPARSALASWRDAVRDAEYDLAGLDERIADYRRR